MSDQWPVILTAALCLAGTFGVSYLGYRGSRRQTADEATRVRPYL